MGFGNKGLAFCRNNGRIMENMDKELTAPKWVLIVRPKIPQIPQKTNFGESRKHKKKKIDLKTRIHELKI